MTQTETRHTESLNTASEFEASLKRAEQKLAIIAQEESTLQAHMQRLQEQLQNLENRAYDRSEEIRLARESETMAHEAFTKAQAYAEVSSGEVSRDILETWEQAQQTMHTVRAKGVQEAEEDAKLRHQAEQELDDAEQGQRTLQARKKAIEQARTRIITEQGEYHLSETLTLLETLRADRDAKKRAAEEAEALLYSIEAQAKEKLAPWPAIQERFEQALSPHKDHMTGLLEDFLTYLDQVIAVAPEQIDMRRFNHNNPYSWQDFHEVFFLDFHMLTTAFSRGSIHDLRGIIHRKEKVQELLANYRRAQLHPEEFQLPAWRGGK